MKVLINRTDAIGDCLLSTPLARLWKEKHPDAHITFLVSPRMGDLIKLCEGVDDVLVFDPKWSLYKKVSFLKKAFKENRWSHFIHLGGSFFPTFFAFLKGVPQRGGLRSKIFSFLFLNKGLRQSRSIVAMHESNYNMALGAPFNIHFNYDKRSSYCPKINITDEQAKEELIISRLPRDRKLILIHPGMSGHTLNWSSRNYGRLIERLHQNLGEEYHFVVSFTPSDEAYLVGLRDYLSQNSHLESFVSFYDGSVRGLIAFTCLLKNACLFVGPSTGTTHLANALGVPQIGIYSPIKVQSVLRWGPFERNNQVKILVPDVVCGESKTCAGPSCPYYECMSKIEVAQAFKAAMDILKPS